MFTSSLLQLPPTTNVIATEIHLASPASPDLVQCTELTGNAAIPPFLVLQFPAGYAIIANNFNFGGNTLNDVLPQVADGTRILKWNFATKTYDSSTYDALPSWWSPNTIFVTARSRLALQPQPHRTSSLPARANTTTSRPNPAPAYAGTAVCAFPLARRVHVRRNHGFRASRR